ncbi:MAG: tRNA (adenosine(37)-N6)-threonylcarbamoyltransferase complex dimerization subunit type 1 TsaB [Rhodospirillaceae bacterium]|nr:tRNA (adenosine(37)-N6)-threonylcarbamoyltransferase complex dimerization subunit type 1 TsaB [Rhodospirillaceae bacterium]
MLILAFDTSGAGLDICLWRDGAVLAAHRAAMDRGQAEALMPAINAVMARAGVDYAALDRVAVTCGPGSFTGVRVSLAAARGIALAADIACIGVASTEVLAAAVPAHERRTGDGTARRIAAVIDTKRGDLYAQMFSADGAALTPPLNVAINQVAQLADAGPLVLVGDAAATVTAALAAGHAVISAAPAHCDAAVLAALAASRAADTGGPAPIYVRPPDITPDPTGGRLRP